MIAARIVGDADAGSAGVAEGERLAAEVLDVVRRELPDDYVWPGNVRELEQCVRSVLVQGAYVPPRRAEVGAAGDASGIARSLVTGEATAEQLLREYVTRVYARVGSYEAAARVLELDRRTVKAKIDPELLEELGVESGRSR